MKVVPFKRVCYAAAVPKVEILVKIHLSNTLTHLWYSGLCGTFINERCVQEENAVHGIP